MGADPQARRGGRGRRWRRRLLLGATAGVSLLAVSALALFIAVVAVPFPVAQLSPQPVEARRVYDRHGRLLREALSDESGRGAWRPLSEISPWVPRAFIAIEDRRFHAHPGVDLRGVLRALRDNLRAGRVVAGGSTLTQQLVGRLSPKRRSLRGKLSEALWALRLERAVGKHAIMEQYVNRVPYGNGTFGVEAAARLYLGRSAKGLSLAQSALLAGIPRAPSRDNPFADRARAFSRQRSVLAQMEAVGEITAAERAEAEAEPIHLLEPERVFAAPHFTTHLLAVSAAEGAPPGDLPSTLDLDLQRRVEAAVRQTLRGLTGRHVRHAAVVVLDNRTGDVLAWVGSGDFFEPRDGQMDMVLAPRQPGSTLKPFLYGLALEQGYSAASHLPDAPIWFPAGLGAWRPKNYDRRHRGEVELREALACSYNVPAVWLTAQLGVGALLKRLHAVGFDTLGRSADFYGLGLVLGNGEVRLLELANAYRALANEGRVGPVRLRHDVAVGDSRRVMPPDVARLLTDILADPIARQPAFGRSDAFEPPFPAAVKTGTGVDFVDNWAVGYTTAVTVAAWVGNADRRPMARVSGSRGAVSLWGAVIREATRDHPAGPFSRKGLALTQRCDAPLADSLDGECTRPRAEWARTQAPRPVESPGTPRALRITFPTREDLLVLDPDAPAEYSRVRLRVERPAEIAALRWEIDGDTVGHGPGGELWWAPTPGVHRLSVVAEGARGAIEDGARDEVRFTVVGRSLAPSPSP